MEKKTQPNIEQPDENKDLNKAINESEDEFLKEDSKEHNNFGNINLTDLINAINWLGITGGGTTQGSTYAGRISSTGIKGSVFPAGWTCSREGVGIYRVYHNLNKNTVTIGRNATSRGLVNISEGLNDFSVASYDQSGALYDSDIYFILSV